jgi:D-alanyl-D-alanine carboxypeptidase (penicillin-binding protein 5/6)
MSRRGGLLLAVIAALVSFVGLAPRAGAAPASPAPKAYIVVDADTGRVLLADHEHDAMPPASTSKIMTALTAVERVPPDAKITVSPLAASQPASRIAMVAGQQWSFEDALASLMIVSANDAAYAIAENTSGTVADFAKAEAETARRYGMRDSTFADPAGLDDAQSFGGGPRMSAYDIAISTRNALSVPELALFAALRERTFTDPAGAQRRLVNHNKFLDGSTRGYAGANGFKTGFTNQAGHTLVATATRDNRTLIAVVLNTWDTYGWAAQLLDQGFAMSPDDKGTGTKLPAVRVSPYAQRLADRSGFLALTRRPDGAPALTDAAATTTTTNAAEGAAFSGTTVAPTTTTRATGGDAEGASAAAARTRADGGSGDGGSGGGGGRLTLRNVLLVVVLLLVVLVMLRRRAVRRQRARRLAARRATANAMRRGSLPVVDGRYRTGTRIGPPVESHVRVRRGPPGDRAS